jgi:uncharacterized protein
MKILISGASGLVGEALTRKLQEDGHDVARLLRPGGRRSSPEDIFWDPMASTVDAPAMEGADAVIHLSGANIAEERWTPARKAVLRSSRIDSTRVLVDTLAGLKRKPRVFLCASATGYYGNRGDELLTESSEGGTDFVALLARDWEAEARRAERAGVRTVLLRFGVILSADGGALPRMLTPFKYGIGGRLGSGNQWMSWIALEDVVEIACSAIASDEFSGPVNVVAPNPMRNSDFTRVVAATLHRPAIFFAPAFALRIVLGEMADPLLLASQRVIPERLTAIGYKFRFPDLDAALQKILQRRS